TTLGLVPLREPGERACRASWGRGPPPRPGGGVFGRQQDAGPPNHAQAGERRRGGLKSCRPARFARAAARGAGGRPPRRPVAPLRGARAAPTRWSSPAGASPRSQGRVLDAKAAPAGEADQVPDHLLVGAAEPLRQARGVAQERAARVALVPG